MNFKKLIIIFLGLLVISSNAVANPKEEKEDVIYAEPTLANYAKTYWRLNKFDINDDQAIDNFLLITECDLYNEFIHNEFEWEGIREAGRQFIMDNKKQFPIHYQFVQPIALGEYDFEAKGFNIAAEHAMRGVQRFEMGADELFYRVCGKKKPIDGYPKALALELTRPFLFTFFPYEQERANELIARKMKVYENLNFEQKKRETYLGMRQVFLVTKVKMFAYKPGDNKSQHGHFQANILGIMEELEVYEDKELTQRIYHKDFRKKRRSRKKDF